MFGATLWLTLATLLGLTAGFTREWLLIDAWGAGNITDALIVALFLPEALRMTMAAGLLSAAALSLYQQRTQAQRAAWLNSMVPRIFICGLLLAGLFAFGSPLLVRLIGPGLSSEALALAQSNLSVLAWCAPGFLLHALLAIPLQAQSRFVLAGLGSLVFNAPPVLYLIMERDQASSSGLIEAFLVGSLLMPALLLPALWRTGWRPWSRASSPGAGVELLRRIGPLLTSNLASQGIALLERMVASWLGEGAITWLNLARKLINLPLIALMSLNQVLLSLMSNSQGNARLSLLRRGLDFATLLSIPATLGLIGSALALVELTIPTATNRELLAQLIAWFSLPLLLSAWNALLARYAYAAGDTLLPLNCELRGSLLNASLLALLPWFMGLPGVALASAAGMLLTTTLLLRRQQLLAATPWRIQWFVAGTSMAIALLTLPIGQTVWQQMLSSAGLACVALLLLAAWLRPWKSTRNNTLKE